MKSQQPWQQTTGQWEQDLGLMTNFYNSFTPAQGQPMHWMIACAIEFRYKGPEINREEALRKAWVEMRHKFPVLAAYVVGSKKIYEPVNDETLATWLASSFRVYHNDTV